MTGPESHWFACWFWFGGEEKEKSDEGCATYEMEKTSVTEEMKEGDCKSNENRKNELVEKKFKDGFIAAGPNQSQ